MRHRTGRSLGVLVLIPILLLALAGIFTASQPAMAENVNYEWTWQNPLPQGNAVADVVAFSASNVFAVGRGGSMFRYNGSTWNALPHVSYNDLVGVDGVTSTDMWVVGSGGLILHYNGTSWLPYTSGTQQWLNHVDAYSATKAWAVGDAGTILYFDGTGWSAQESHTTQNLIGVHALDPNHVWAVGIGGTVLFFNGTDWVSQDSHTSNDLGCVLAFDDNNVYAVGANDTLLVYDGSDWAAKTTGVSGHWRGITALSASSIWVVGTETAYPWGGAVAYYDGSDWTQQTSNSVNTLYATAAADASHVFAVGGGGDLMFYNGSVWANQLTGDIHLLWSADALDADHVWACGQFSTVLSSEDAGSTWTSQTIGGYSKEFLDIDAVAENDVWVCGNDIWHYNGTAWSESLTNNNQFGGLYALDSTHVWAVGMGGIIKFWNGHIWTDQDLDHDLYGDFCLRDVYAADDNHVWAVGNNGLTGEDAIVFFYNGSQWVPQYLTGLDTTLYSIDGVGTSDIWVTGGGYADYPLGGVMLHYNGTAWSQKTSPSTNWGELIGRVSVIDSSHIWAVDSSGEIMFYDGASWSFYTSPCRQDLRGLTTIDSAHIWISGSNGTIVFGEPSTPFITKVTPLADYPGQVVTIDGVNFGATRNTSTVTFGGFTPADSDYVFWGDGQIQVKVPAGAYGGPVSVKATVTGVDSNEMNFSVVPHVTTLSPSTGWAGRTVTLNGSGFGPTRGSSKVFFGATEVTDYVSWGNSSIQVKVPSMALGATQVKVTTSGGDSDPLGFAVEYPPATVTSITPSSWPTGQSASITNLAGTGFRAGATVRLRKSGYADIVATGVNVVSAGKITCTFNLAGAPQGACDVFVQNTDGKNATKANAFTVKAPVYPTWYLAEGTTAWGFSTYISIQNPNTAAVHAAITYMTGTGNVSGGTITLPAKSQTTVNPADTLGNKDFSTKVVCTDGNAIAVDRTMTWTGPGAASPEGHSSVGVTAPAKTWYLPEGASAWGFETWLLIQNPNAATANCTVTYMIEGGAPVTRTHTVPGNSRQSFNMEADIGQKNASIKVVSNIPVIPERAMYRNNKREGHDSIGTTTSATDYFLAEGTTAWGFTTWVLIQNPGSSPSDVTITYMTPSGKKAQPSFSLPGNSRKTIKVNDVAGMANTDFSTQVHGSSLIIAERSMYWDNGTGEACHDSIGMDQAHSTFYLPDGQTSGGYETWTLVQNPNASAVTVEVSYLKAGGGAVILTSSIPANSRMTFNMADKVPSGRASIMVTSKTAGKTIMVERAMYWNNKGAGTDTIGGYSD